MLISLEMTADYFETNEKYLYSDYKYKKHIKKDEKGTIRFDIDNFNKEQSIKQKKEDFCITMAAFAEFVIDIIGEKNFYQNIPTLKRQHIKRGIEKSKLSYNYGKMVQELFEEKYFHYYEDGTFPVSEYIPPEKRKSLSANFVMTEYWSRQKTTFEIAQELNVPEYWVINEIRKLGLFKKDNGVIKKGGLKGLVMTKEQKEKRQNQPHAKPIVQICPKTFKIVKEYSSQGAVNRYGFKRENVRKAMKRCGLSGGYLWAFKGLEQATINVAKRRTKINVRVQAHEYVPPTKKELYELYIVQGKTARQIANKYKCHKNTIAQLCSKLKLHKPKSNLTIEKLKKHYLEEKMIAKDIAKMYGVSTKTVATYLSKNKIRKYK